MKKGCLIFLSAIILLVGCKNDDTALQSNEPLNLEGLWDVIIVWDSLYSGYPPVKRENVARYGVMQIEQIYDSLYINIRYAGYNYDTRYLGSVLSDNTIRIDCAENSVYLERITGRLSGDRKEITGSGLLQYSTYQSAGTFTAKKN